MGAPAAADNRPGLYSVTHAHINKNLNRCSMHISSDRGASIHAPQWRTFTPFCSYLHFECSSLLKKKQNIYKSIFYPWLFYVGVNRTHFCLFQVSENASAYVLLRLLAALVPKFSADNLPREVCWDVATQLLRKEERHLSKKRFLVSGDNRPKNGTQCRTNDETNAECRLMISMTFIWEKIQLFRTKIVH